jgi:hypothetical protein
MYNVEPKVEINITSIPFKKAYREVHDVDEHDIIAIIREDKLLTTISSLESKLNILNRQAVNVRSYEQVLRQIARQETLFAENKFVWLFLGNVPKDFYDRLLELVITENNEKLTIGDYALLLYLTYEEKDIQDALKDVPLSILKMTYEPLVDSTIDAWQEKAKKTLG